MSNIKYQICEDKDEEPRIETSQALQNMFYKYTHLPVGGKEIACPYWINNLKQGIFGPYGGKGTPEQIIEAVSLEAIKAGVDLDKMSGAEIENFMKKKKIGVDCSGFVFWMLDALDREKGGKGIADDIPGSVGRYLRARASVRMLTGEEVTRPIELKDIQVGDMIRLNRGKHVAIVISIERDLKKTGELKEIHYAHSSNRTKINGVHSAKIEVVDNSGLESQRWKEEAANGGNYGREFFLPRFGDGIKRLNSWV